MYGFIEKVIVFNGTVLTELSIERTNIITWIRKYKINDYQYEIETFIDSIVRE